MKVLILGDSHTWGSYGKNLEKLFEDAGSTVTRVAIVGAAAFHYNNGTQNSVSRSRVGEFKDAIKDSYDLAVVSLGTNDVGIRGTKNTVEDLKTLLGTIKATNIVWVGPPASSDYASRNYNPAYAKKDLNTRVSELYAAAESEIGVPIIDPREATKPYVQKTDIHFGKKGGAAWAQYVFDQLQGAIKEEQSGVSTAVKKAGGSILWALLLGGAVFLGYRAWKEFRKRGA